MNKNTPYQDEHDAFFANITYDKVKNPMSFKAFIKDIKNSFNFKNILTNKRGKYNDKDTLGYIRPINKRGRDQLKCLIAHWKSWKLTGSTQDYCWHCKYIFRMSGTSSAGVTTECKLGHWRQESS